jgi:cell division protein FtsB
MRKLKETWTARQKPWQMSNAPTMPAARRPRRRSVIRWDRVARISLLAIMALILASYIGPATKYIRAWQLSNETRAELTQLQTEQKQLKQRYKELKNPRTIELEARKVGMARPDEKVYVIKGLRRSGKSASK